MFEFFKKFFKKETEKVSIKFADLGSWLDDKTKSYNSEFLDYIKREKDNLKAIKNELSRAIGELKEAKIEDEDKIIPKIKSVVIAARNDYIRNMEHLIIELDPDDSSEDSALQSCRLMHDKLDAFAKRTTKEYFKTQHLFHKPLESIAKHLKELGKKVEGLKSYAQNSRIFRAREIKKLLDKINEDIHVLEGLTKSSEEFERQRDSKEKELETAKKNIAELEKSDGYFEYQKDIERLNKLKEGLKRKGDEIYGLLAPLQAGLKRYLRVALENLEILSRYIDDPVKALADDDGFTILIVLEKLKEILGKGDLEIKDDKRKKMTNIISSITRDKLEGLRNSYLEFERGAEEVKEIIERNEVQAQKEELLKKREKLAGELMSLETELKHIREKISKFDIDKEKKRLIEQLNKLFELEVVLE
jgi:hypothetical protein